MRTGAQAYARPEGTPCGRLTHCARIVNDQARSLVPRAHCLQALVIAGQSIRKRPWAVPLAPLAGRPDGLDPPGSKTMEAIVRRLLPDNT